MSDGAPEPASPADDASHDAPRVLVAEDETHLGVLVEQFLSARGCRVTLVRDGRDALARMREGGWDVVLTDVQMPGLDGLALVRAAREIALAPEIVVVTGNGTSETALQALRLGAYDYATKPFRMAEIELLVRRAAEKHRLRRALAARPAEPTAVVPFETVDPTLATAVEALAADPSTAPLLLVGEAGTGRETLARWLHARARRAGPFVAVDMAHVPPARHRERLLGSDGRDASDAAVAAARAVPLFAAASRGTLLVRGADRLAADVLAALLDAADAVRDGAHDAVLVLAVPHADALPSAARARVPRCVALPPLADRPDDVPLLAASIARRAAGEPAVIAPDARALLAARPWPGHVAELAAVVRAAVDRARARRVDDALPLVLDAAALAPPVGAAGGAGALG